MLKLRKKSQLNVELHDYVLRAIIQKGAAIKDWRAVELPIRHGIIEGTAIADEPALFELLQQNLVALGGKKQKTNVFAPDNVVLLKKIEYPDTVDPKDLKGYLNMEIGQSIHLPFEEPLIDVYDANPGGGEATLFAAASEEVRKMVGLLLDVQLQPHRMDIRALCNLRFLERLKLIDDERTYLLSDWSINGVSICIYSAGQIEFLRYQTIDTDLTKWELVTKYRQELLFAYTEEESGYMELIENEVMEIERMMNFFKFSLHKGEREVDAIIVLGDNPLLEQIHVILQEHLAVAVKRVTDKMVQLEFPQFQARHAALLGLALKEGAI